MLTLPDYPPQFWVTAVIALVLLGIAKGGFGGGGALATPLMSLVIPVTDAAALLLVLLIIIDMVNVQHYRHHFNRPTLKNMLIGGIFGVVIGGFTFHLLTDNERTFKLLIGIVVLAYVAYQVLPFPQLSISQESRWFRPIGVVLGAISGFMSTLIHAGGPPAVMYVLPQNLSRQNYVGTLAIFFTFMNLMKLVPYTLLGLIRVGNLTTILLLSPICFLSARLGIYLNKRFDPLWFNRIVYILLALTAIQLIAGDSLIKQLF